MNQNSRKKSHKNKCQSIRDNKEKQMPIVLSVATEYRVLNNNKNHPAHPLRHPLHPWSPGNTHGRVNAPGSVCVSFSNHVRAGMTSPSPSSRNCESAESRRREPSPGAGQAPPPARPHVALGPPRASRRAPASLRIPTTLPPRSRRGSDRWRCGCDRRPPHSAIGEPPLKSARGTAAEPTEASNRAI